MLHKTSGKMAGQARQVSVAGEDLQKTGKRNSSLESYLGGLLAGPVVVFQRLTAAGLARYDSCQDVYSPGNPAIDSRLANRLIHILAWVVAGKSRFGQVRKNHYRAS